MITNPSPNSPAAAYAPARARAALSRMKPPAWLLPVVLAVAGLVAAFVFLRPAPAAATVGRMPTIAAKKPARKTGARRPGSAAAKPLPRLKAGQPVAGFLVGTVKFSPGYDPAAPAFAASDWKS